MILNRINSPYKVINSEVHNIGRVTVVTVTFLIDGKEYPYTYVINKDSVCIIPVIEDQVVVIELIQIYIRQMAFRISGRRC